jgi:hypothetical protein
MEERSNDRSGLQTAATLAKFAKAVAQIAKAAAEGGIYGAAIAAVKESLPILIKVVIAILVVVLVVPMVVFMALPNIFFGYDTSSTDSVKQMTQQALTIGGTYMSLEDFEATQVDSIVTSIASEYENNGTHIDQIEVQSSLDQEDLLWFIAINSVAHQQDLDTMSAEEIRSSSVSRLSFTPTLGTLLGENNSTETTLTVEVKKLDPEELMEQLGFDEEAKTWAGALYETLSKSDAIGQYSSYYTKYSPSYSGESSGSSTAEHGSQYGNEIDISGFTSPNTKNNLDLAAYAIQAWENNWGYVWGTYGNVLTQSLLDYKANQYPNGVGNYKDFIEENWLGRRTTDCIGLVKGYGWLDPNTRTINYGTNGMPDYSANQMYQDAKSHGAEYGAISTMPEIPGLVLWKDGHTGVYIGGGYAIEARGTSSGVVKTKVDGRGWQAWYKSPYITYMDGD